MSIRQWAILCGSAGIDIRSLDSMECYMLAGKILRDAELEADVRKYAGCAAPADLRQKILHSWSETQRAALRERISGVLQIEKRK